MAAVAEGAVVVVVVVVDVIVVGVGGGFCFCFFLLAASWGCHWVLRQNSVHLVNRFLYPHKELHARFTGSISKQSANSPGEVFLTSCDKYRILLAKL